MSLQAYARKRDFGHTPEPKPSRARPPKVGRFVVQKHAASRLHYDFRLEMDGTLKSWAVPKGIPTVQGEKRLAVRVEDHPVSYFSFEGTIPKGEYGGGTVMVWDQGTYETLGPNPTQGLRTGKLHLRLQGHKLKGDWHLVRLRDADHWLLIRASPEPPHLPASAQDASVLTGRSMAAITDGKPVRSRPPKSARTPRRASPKNAVHRSKASPRNDFIAPMLALGATKARPGEWMHEIKFDGYRALAYKDGDQIHLRSRNQNDFAGLFPEVAEAVAQLPPDEVVVDGEIVALDPHGQSSFQLLQRVQSGGPRPPIYYYVFDLLRLEGEDLRARPLHERKARLETLLRKPPGLIRHAASLGGDFDRVLAQVRKHGLEGVIAKRRDSPYESGRRSGAWLKFKLHREQEFVIGGLTDPTGRRSRFGALLVGYHEGRQLRFAGKVGTGFDESTLEHLHSLFVPLLQDGPPFTDDPGKAGGGIAPFLKSPEMRHCHWLQPRLVCQVRFTGWTQDGRLRHPVFLGLREDKHPAEVVREPVVAP